MAGAIKVEYRSQWPMDGTDRLAQDNPPLTAFLEIFDGPVLVLDDRGDIVIVNQAWTDLDSEGIGEPSQGLTGRHVLSLFEKVVGMGPDSAQSAALGVEDVHSGRRETFTLEYPCRWHKPPEWFRMKAHRTRSPERTWVVLCFSDISEHRRTANALAESEKRYRRFVDTTADGMLVYADDGRILEANDAACRLSGYSIMELTQMSIKDIEALESADDIAARIDRTRLHGFDRFETRHRCKNGTLIDVEVSASIFDEVGSGGIAFIRDIRKRKWAEEEVKSLKDFYGLILDNVHDGIWVTDGDERLVYINPGMERIAGVEAEAVLGLDVTQDFPPETTEQFLEFYHKAKRQRITQPYEAEVVTPAGRRTIQSGWLIPRFEGRDYNGMICSIQDITARKQAENALRESERRYRRLFENIMNGFALHEIVLNDEGMPVDYVFLEVNHAFERLTGLKRDILIGKRVTEALPGIEHDPADWIGRYGQVALTGQDIRFEQYAQALGKWYAVLAFRPRKNQFATVFEDISERKQNEEKLLAYQQRLKSLTSQLTLAEERLKSTLAIQLHDDICQRLAMLRVDIGVECDACKEPQPRLRLEHMYDVVGQILEETRHLTSKLSYPALSLYSLDEAMRKWSEQEIQRKHGIDVMVQDDGEAKPLTQDVKAVLFRGVRELLMNVVKHASASAVDIRIRRREDAIEVVVADNGVGLANQVADQHAGGGFGIMSVEEAIEGLGGYLHYPCDSEQGCTACIMAPLADVGQ